MLGKIWTRSINRSLPCLLSIIFDCWGENFAREKPNPPSTPCLYLFIFIFFKTEQTLWHCRLSSVHYSSDVSPTSFPLLTLHPHSYWEALERISWTEKKRGKTNPESLLFLIFPDPFIIFIYSEQHLTLPSHPPLLGTSRGLLPPCAPFSPASRCALRFYSYPEHESIKRGKESGWAPRLEKCTPFVYGSGMKATSWSRTRICQPLGKGAANNGSAEYPEHIKQSFIGYAGLKFDISVLTLINQAWKITV